MLCYFLNFLLLFRFINTFIPNKIPRGGGGGVREGLGVAKNIDFHIANFLSIWNCITIGSVMHFHIKQIEFHITKILKEIIAKFAYCFVIGT